MEVSRTRPEVIEAYREYSPPCDARGTVEVLLRYVPAEYLTGLRTILLINSSALRCDERRQKSWSRNRKVRLAESAGSYHQAMPDRPASIRILVDNVLGPVPRFVLCLPLLRFLMFADVLYHEIGHHIHTTRRPEHREREEVAEAWQKKLTAKFFRARYWYLIPLAYAIRFTMDVGKVSARFARKLGRWLGVKR